MYFNEIFPIGLYRLEICAILFLLDLKREVFTEIHVTI
jgi:hypothetical protein